MTEEVSGSKAAKRTVLRTTLNTMLSTVPPEWEIYPLDALGEIVTGQTPNTGRPEYFGEDIPFVSPTDLDGERYITHTQTMLSEEGAKQVRMLPANAILVTCIGTLGKVGQAGIPLTTNQQINGIIPNAKLYPAYGFWVAHLLKAQLDAMAGLQAVPIVNKSLFAQLHLPCPPLAEQHAIAHILDTIEIQIQQTLRLIAKLKQIKVGLLQDLLTCGVDEHGTVRDPVVHPEEFCDSPLGRIPQAWHIDHLIQHVSLPDGQIDPQKSPYCDWPLIAPDHIEPETGRLLHIETASQQNVTSGKYCFQPDDVLYSKIRPHLRKAVLVHEKGICSADMYPLRPRNTITPEFLLATILSEHFSRFAIAASMRSGFPKINQQELAEYMFVLPPHEEQRRISCILQAQDKCLLAEEAHVSKLRLVKQGLMDDLLTGRVRVAV
jgi:type I restriction enzyme, S subunit